MWVQTKPAYDDLHIDVVAQHGRDERKDEELLESLDEVDAESLAGLKQKALDMDDDMPDTSSFGIGSVSPQDFSGEEPEADSTVERSAAKEV